MLCPRCSRENHDEANICIYCHYPLSDVPRAQRGPDVRTSRLAVASCILAVLGLPCFFIYSRAVMQKFGPPAPAFAVIFLISDVLAVLIGLSALACIEMNRGRLTGRAFAAAGAAIPIAAFFLTTVYVVLNRPRSTAYRLYFGTNLSGIGKSILIYTQDYDDRFPRAGGPNSRWGPTPNWQADTRAEAYGLKYGAGQASISASFFLLIKYAEVTPKSFLCKGDDKVSEFTLSKYEVRGKDVVDLWDFGPDPSKHCSFSYHIPYGPYSLTCSSDPGMAVAAERNPWIRSPGAMPRKFNSFDPVGNKKAVQAGNTTSHKKEGGQVVLYVDGHVDFEKESFCGVNDDNIYTVQNGTDVRKGIRPTMDSQPANKNDSVLVHDPPRENSK